MAIVLLDMKNVVRITDEVFRYKNGKMVQLLLLIFFLQKLLLVFFSRVNTPPAKSITLHCVFHIYVKHLSRYG